MRFNWRQSVVLITGGTGSFGVAFTNYLLKYCKPKAIRIFSRDELKQYQMQQKFSDNRLRFLLGDVRDKDRLVRAMEGVDVVVHAAALKQIPLGEYNPFEPIQTNIIGTKNVIEAALDTKVTRSILISSDKAAYPVNLYGATKMCAERLFVQGNVYVGKQKMMFAVVRYGNVLGSRGSVVPLFRVQKTEGKLTITDSHMTRFWISLEQACKFVDRVIEQMRGGEVFIPKLPSVKIVDLAKAIAPKAEIKTTGIRPGEKLHEVLITEEESRRVKEYADYYVIDPEFPFWKNKLEPRGRPRKPFIYRSDTNDRVLSTSQIKRILIGLE